jgi:hypothetical protein
MADPKGSKGGTTMDGVNVQTRNAILVEMEDLAEADRKELERELKEEMAKARRRKLACFQKMRNGVIKKADNAADVSLSPEDLVQLVDVFVASKYGADLTQFT